MGNVELGHVEVKSEPVGTMTTLPVLSGVHDTGNVCFPKLDAEVGYRTDKFLGGGASKVSWVEQLTEPSRLVEQQRHSSVR